MAKTYDKDVRFAARHLSLHEDTVYRLIAKGEIAHLRVGPRGRIRLAVEDLDAWTARHVVPAKVVPEATPEAPRSRSVLPVLPLPAVRVFGGRR